MSDRTTVGTLDASAIPRKNFIDESIFGRMATAGIRSAPLASDLEFLRRVTLDLTGRIPSGADVVKFINDPNPSKRDLKVDALMGSPEFVDKWTMFLGDLYKNNAMNNNVNRDVNGRDSFYLYLKDAVSTNKPYDQIARDLITASGDSLLMGKSTGRWVTRSRWDRLRIPMTVRPLTCHRCSWASMSPIAYSVMTVLAIWTR